MSVGPEAHADPVPERSPVAEAWRQVVAPPPREATKSWEVEAIPVTVKIDEVEFPRVPLPTLKVVAKRFVDEAVVEKKLVEVEFEVVELSPVKFWRVEEPRVRNPVE